MISAGAFFSGGMDSTETEQNTTQSKEENNDAGDPSSNDCGSERDSNVPHGPAGTQVWAGPPSDVSPPGMVPQPLQHSTQPGMVDPLSYRYNVQSFTFTNTFLTLIICLL